MWFGDYDSRDKNILLSAFNPNAAVWWLSQNEWCFPYEKREAPSCVLLGTLFITYTGTDSHTIIGGNRIGYRTCYARCT